MKILLQEGYDNQPVQFEGLTITPVRLYIEEKPWSGRGPSVSLKLNVAGEYSEHLFYLHYLGTGDEKFPEAIENCLFSLEIDDTDVKTDVRLVVAKNAFDTPFFLDLYRRVTIGRVAVCFEDAIHEVATYEPGGPEVHDSFIKFSLWDRNRRNLFPFMASELHKDGQLVYEWRDFRVWVLGYNQEFLKLKIEKIEP